MMKQLLFIVLIGVCAGAAVVWCAALLSGPVWVVHATVTVARASPLTGGLDAIETGLRDPELLRAVARVAGGSLSRLSDRGLARHTRVVPRGDDTLKLACRADDPHLAERFARAWVEQAARALNSDADRRAEQEAARFRETLFREERLLASDGEAVRAALMERGVAGDGAERVLAEIGTGDDPSRGLREEEARLDKELSDDAARERTLAAQEESLARAVAREERYVITYQVKEENPIVRDLNRQLNEKQMKLQQLRVDSTTRHPMRARLEQEIARTQELLKDKPRESIKEQRRELNPVYNDISMQLSRVRRDLDALKIHAARSRGLLAAQRAKLSLMGEGDGKDDSPLARYRVRSAEVRRLRGLCAGGSERRAGGVELKITEVTTAMETNDTARGMGKRIILGAAAGGCGGLLIGAWVRARRQ